MNCELQVGNVCDEQANMYVSRRRQQGLANRHSRRVCSENDADRCVSMYMYFSMCESKDICIHSVGGPRSHVVEYRPRHTGLTHNTMQWFTIN